MKDQTEQAAILRSFQDDLITLVKKYSTMGVAYNDLMALVLNVAAVMSKKRMTLQSVLKVLEHAYYLADRKDESGIN